MYKVESQWELREGILLLYLDKEIPRYEPYRFYRIEGKIFDPVPMSHTGGKCIAIKADGDFVGKRVEFLAEKP